MLKVRPTGTGSGFRHRLRARSSWSHASARHPAFRDRGLGARAARRSRPGGIMTRLSLKPAGSRRSRAFHNIHYANYLIAAPCPVWTMLKPGTPASAPRRSRIVVAKPRASDHLNSAPKALISRRNSGGEGWQNAIASSGDVGSALSVPRSPDLKRTGMARGSHLARADGIDAVLRRLALVGDRVIERAAPIVR